MYNKKRKFIPISWIFIIGILITCIISNIQDNNRSLNLLGYRPVLVVSGSMLPSIQINSMSIMQYCHIDDIEVGDVIMYYHPTMKINITHRCIAKDIDTYTGDEYLTVKGDANGIEDNIRVTDELIVGKLVKTFNTTAPYISLLMDDSQTGTVKKTTFFIFIIMLASLITTVILILGFIRNILRIAYYVIFRQHDVDNAIEKLKLEEIQTRNIPDLCKRLNREKGDGLLGTLAKIMAFYQIEKLNYSIEDLTSMMKVARSISKGEFKQAFGKNIESDNKSKSSSGSSSGDKL